VKCENTECIYLPNTENKFVVKCEQAYIHQGIAEDSKQFHS